MGLTLETIMRSRQPQPTMGTGDRRLNAVEIVSGRLVRRLA
jgi:hypothetical protein